ncbi:hypothetical protein a10_03057 [Streptomyces acidiscabies]|nr:hypothetical protein a10_03057 [Streptomyces acidiscabies]
MEIKAGETVIFVGPSGCGKPLLLIALTCYAIGFWALTRI